MVDTRVRTRFTAVDTPCDQRTHLAPPAVKRKIPQVVVQVKITDNCTASVRKLRSYPALAGWQNVSSRSTARGERQLRVNVPSMYRALLTMISPTCNPEHAGFQSCKIQDYNPQILP